MPPSENRLPDIAIGRHPEFGIVATTPRDLAASAWMLRGFGFHPVPGQPHVYALADQHRDGHKRATHAVDVLRRANYRVQADAEFDPFPAAPHTPPSRSAAKRVEPDVAFADHPQLGIVAASDSGTAEELLEDHGWLHKPELDIYALPVTVSREHALDQVVQTTVAMQRTNLDVAVQPALAREVTSRRHVPGRSDLAASPTHASRLGTTPPPRPAAASSTPLPQPQTRRLR